MVSSVLRKPCQLELRNLIDGVFCFVFADGRAISMDRCIRISHNYLLVRSGGHWHGAVDSIRRLSRHSALYDRNSDWHIMRGRVDGIAHLAVALIEFLNKSSCFQ